MFFEVTCQRTLHPPSFVEIHLAAFVLTLCQANNPSDKRANSAKKKKKNLLSVLPVYCRSLDLTISIGTQPPWESSLCFICVSLLTSHCQIMLWASQDITRSEAQAGHFQVGAALPQGAEEAYTSKILSSSTGSQCWVTQRRLSDVCKQRCWHYHQRPPCRFPFPLAKSHSGRKCCRRCCQLGAISFWNCAMYDCDWDQTVTICGHWDRGRSRSYSRWGSYFILVDSGGERVWGGWKAL